MRRGAREAAVEIRMIDVPKQPRRGSGCEGAWATSNADAKPAPASPSQRGSQASAADRRALTAAVLADPEAVATVVSALAKREQVGKVPSVASGCGRANHVRAVEDGLFA